MQAVESDCGSIIFIEHPTEKVQIRAVTADPELFIYIGSPTEKGQVCGGQRMCGQYHVYIQTI